MKHVQSIDDIKAGTIYLMFQREKRYFKEFLPIIPNDEDPIKTWRTFKYGKGFSISYCDYEVVISKPILHNQRFNLCAEEYFELTDRECIELIDFI